MSILPPDSDTGVAPETETFCYRHPDRATRLRCSRCDRPICPSCSTPATVGQHCPECIGEARRSTPKVRSAMAATAPVVVTLLVLNVIAYLLQLAGVGSSGNSDLFTLRWAMFPPAIADGEWWRLLTATFLHSPDTIFHIGMNMLVLWVYGPNVEQAFGHVRFAIMYVIAGFFASATSYALGGCNVVGVGASGAIFGVVGMLFMFLYKRRSSQFVQQHLSGLYTFIGLNLLISFAFSSFIDWRAHVGGLVAGAAMGAGVDTPAGRPPMGTQLMALAGVLAFGIALVAWKTASGAC